MKKTTDIQSAANSRWQPDWVVTTKGGSPVGVTRDDHCLVVLSPDRNGQWHPIKHIPDAVIQLIGKLVSEGVLNY